MFYLLTVMNDEISLDSKASRSLLSLELPNAFGLIFDAHQLCVVPIISISQSLSIFMFHVLDLLGISFWIVYNFVVNFLIATLAQAVRMVWTILVNALGCFLFVAEGDVAIVAHKF